MTLPAFRRKHQDCLSAEQPLDSLCVRRRCANLLVEQTADPRRLVPAQVALRTLVPENLSGAGYMKPALCAFVGLDLGHLVIWCFRLVR